MFSLPAHFPLFPFFSLNVTTVLDFLFFTPLSNAILGHVKSSEYGTIISVALSCRRRRQGGAEPAPFFPRFASRRPEG